MGNNKSPYDRYNWDSPFSVTNPDSPYYNRKVVPPNLLAMPILLLFGALPFLVKTLFKYFESTQYTLLYWGLTMLVLLMVLVYAAGWKQTLLGVGAFILFTAVICVIMEFTR